VSRSGEKVSTSEQWAMNRCCGLWPKGGFGLVLAFLFPFPAQNKMVNTFTSRDLPDIVSSRAMPFLLFTLLPVALAICPPIDLRVEYASNPQVASPLFNGNILSVPDLFLPTK
jgi:hypothetical protein